MKKIISVIIIIATLMMCVQSQIVNASAKTISLAKANSKSIEDMDEHEYEFTLKSKTKINIWLDSEKELDFEIWDDEADTVFEKEDVDYINKSITLSKGSYSVYISYYSDDYDYDDNVYSLSISVTKATKISFNSKNNTINCGTSKKLSYNANGYIKSLTWKSSNTKVATVNSSGNVTAKGLGKCTVSVKSSYGCSAKTSVIVNNRNMYVFKNSTKSTPTINGKSISGWKRSNNKISVGKKVQGISQGKSVISKKVSGINYKANIYITDYKKLRDAAKKHLKNILKDPDSLKIYHTYIGYDIDGMPSVVFDYGAKNSYGGYVRDYISYSYNNKFKLYYGTYQTMPYLSSKKEI